MGFLLRFSFLSSTRLSSFAILFYTIIGWIVKIYMKNSDWISKREFSRYPVVIFRKRLKCVEIHLLVLLLDEKFTFFWNKRRHYTQEFEGRRKKDHSTSLRKVSSWPSLHSPSTFFSFSRFSFIHYSSFSLFFSKKASKQFFFFYDEEKLSNFRLLLFYDFLTTWKWQV